jgi:hypothetical protein
MPNRQNKNTALKTSTKSCVEQLHEYGIIKYVGINSAFVG